MKDIEKSFLDNHNKEKDIWRIFRIISDFTEAHEVFATLPSAVSIFGSARTPKKNRYYKKTVEISQKLSDKGFAIVTGGGGGIMEAGNKGAKVSVGLNIKLPQEQKINKYVKYSLNFKYFFTRKVTFIKHSVAFIAMPGGFGTLDELSEALCLVQTKRTGAFPIVLFGKEFYKPLEKFFKVMLEHDYISKEDLKLYIITDDIDEAIEFIEKYKGKK
ncbi:TIGR00730 family Rossman fold protein [Arcobacteraceae bacterium]|nr:TIGR00730 family Rossman fold protein [Arcobacteraceae bacterium]